MIYRFGEYELDTRVYELRRKGSVNPVEPQVFDVLAYLVQHRDRLVTKEELLEKLWPDRFVAETTLTSRLKEARKAVGDTGRAQSVIRTQRGRGYRFVAEVLERDEPIHATCGAGGSSTPRSSTPPLGSEPSLPDIAPGVLRSSLPPDGADSRGFVGRAEELRRLENALEQMIAGNRRIVFVTGEAGAGKTTLVDAFLSRQAGERGVLVSRGQCVEYRGSGEPYMPLLDAFARLASMQENARLVEVLRRKAPSWLVQMPSVATEEEISLLRARSGTSGERMLRELGMLVDHVISEIPLLVVLEDLHWSDYATLDAIDLLARQRSDGRLMVVGTWRPSDVKAARHPIYALTQELRARNQCELIRLRLLDERELDAYLRLRFDDAGFVERVAPVLHSRTGGNALFARNLVDSWIEHGLILQEGGRWQLPGDLEALENDVPDTLQHLIENQVAELDPGQQRILETAAVIGRAFPVSLIAASLPAAEDDIERECERLTRESSIILGNGTEQWGDGSLTSRFSFVHDLYVDVLYERIPAVRRSRLHQQVGQALQRAWHGREIQRAPELALHFQRALDRENGPKYLELAAEQALERSAHREAVEHLTAALELITGLPDNETSRLAELRIRCRLAPSLIATRGFTDSGAEENYLRSKELAAELGDLALLSQTLYGLANMYEYAGQYSMAEKTTRERIRLENQDSCERTLESHELLTCSLLHQGRYKESVRHGEVALAAYSEMTAEQLQPDVLVLVVQAYGWMSGSLHFAGRTEDAIAHSRRAVELADESSNELARASANIQAAFLRFYRSEPEDCLRLARAGAAIGREHRFPFHVACGRILSGWAELDAIGLAEAVREIRAGIRTCESIGARMDLPLFHAILAECFLRSDELDSAIEALDAGIALVNRGRTFFYAPEIYRLFGFTLSRQGTRRRVEAIDTIRHALAMSEEQDCLLFTLRSLVDLVELEGESWTPRLREVVAEFRQGLDTADLARARQALGES